MCHCMICVVFNFLSYVCTWVTLNNRFSWDLTEHFSYKQSPKLCLCSSKLYYSGREACFFRVILWSTSSLMQIGWHDCDMSSTSSDKEQPWISRSKTAEQSRLALASILGLFWVYLPKFTLLTPFLHTSSFSLLFLGSHRGVTRSSC